MKELLADKNSLKFDIRIVRQNSALGGVYPCAMQPQNVLHFWFTEVTPQQHFAKDAALD